MVLTGWILRILVVLFLIRLLVRFFVGARQAARRGASAKRTTPATREGGHLVRDPQCGTYLPEGRALRLGTGAGAIYFCSEACRIEWTAARKAG